MQSLIEQFEAVAKGIRGALGDSELPVQLEQLEIALGNLCKDGGRHIVARLLGGTVLCARGFGEAPNAAPQVNLPRGIHVA